MIFVVTMTWSVDKTPEVAKRAAQLVKQPPKGVKVLASYVLLGRCEAVLVYDVPDEKTIFEVHMPLSDIAECDWAPAMATEDVLKSLGM